MDRVYVNRCSGCGKVFGASSVEFPDWDFREDLCECGKTQIWRVMWYEMSWLYGNLVVWADVEV